MLNVNLWLPESLYKGLVDRAARENLTIQQLAVSLLSVPLESIGSVFAIKCVTCGMPWVVHKSACPRHEHRPHWSRIEA